MVPVSPLVRGAGYRTNPAPRINREIFPFGRKPLIQADFLGFTAASRNYVAHSSQHTTTVLPPTFTWIVEFRTSG